MKTAIALAGGILAALPGSALADGNTGTVYGRVLLSTTEQPVCRITVRALSNREGPWETNTGADGSFVFLSIRPGPVTIVIGRGREFRQISVSANLQNQETFYLPPLPRSLRTVTHVQFAARDWPCPRSSYRGYMLTDYDPNSSWLSR
jgi:hypothetical protein